jgi:hypothetical protein
VGADPEPIDFSDRIASDRRRVLEVIDQVLALDYLAPDLRRRVIKLQRGLVEAELSARDRARERRSSD